MHRLSARRLTPHPDEALPSPSDALLLDRIGWELRPEDGVAIRGDVRFLAGTQPRSAVVICHGFKGFRRWGFFPPLARALTRRGHAAVSFDFSRNGVGADGVDFSALERFEENTHSRNVDEIRLVLDAIARGRIPGCEGAARIGLFGHSRGGGEAILAAAEDPRVEALVTWASIAGPMTTRSAGGGGKRSPSPTPARGSPCRWGRVSGVTSSATPTGSPSRRRPSASGLPG
jgi:pimeloyl-ACP methyl ester carboxylesterase